MSAPTDTRIRLGDTVRTDVGDLDFLQWNTRVGKHIASYVKDLEPVGEPDERWTANVVVTSADLVDWAAAEYAAVEKADRPALPTEVLNADGCRVFGRLTKAGWQGAALVLSSDVESAATVLDSLAHSTGTRLGLLVTVTHGETWVVEVTSRRS